MSNFRIQKVNQDVKMWISKVIRDDINDPAIPKMCSVIRADVTKDLKHAKVFVSVLGNEEKNDVAVKALNKAAGFIKHRLSEMMKTRSVPTLKFVGDTSIQYSIDISKKLEDIKHEK